MSWILIEYGIYPWHLYLSRILSGLSSGGGFTLVPIFIAEISESRYVPSDFAATFTKAELIVHSFIGSFIVMLGMR